MQRGREPSTSIHNDQRNSDISLTSFACCNEDLQSSLFLLHPSCASEVQLAEGSCNFAPFPTEWTEHDCTSSIIEAMRSYASTPLHSSQIEVNVVCLLPSPSPSVCQSNSLQARSESFHCTRLHFRSISSHSLPAALNLTIMQLQQQRQQQREEAEQQTSEEDRNTSSSSAAAKIKKTVCDKENLATSRPLPQTSHHRTLKQNQWHE